MLRIRPKMRGGYGLLTREIDLYVENIGDTAAKDVVVICRITPFNVCLKHNKGVHKIPLLVPNRPVKFTIVSDEDLSFLLSSNLHIEATYSYMDGKKSRQIKMTIAVIEIEFTSAGY